MAKAMSEVWKMQLSWNFSIEDFLKPHPEAGLVPMRLLTDAIATSDLREAVF